MKIRHFAIALVSAPILSHAAWTVDTVDSTSFGGFGVSLVLSPAGVPSISYQRPTSEGSAFFDAYYAKKSGGSWTTESVYSATQFPGATTSIVLTNLGNPAVAFTTSSTFLRFYLRSSGGSWASLGAMAGTITGEASGFVSAIWRGTEAAPDPIITYHDVMGADLERAYMTAGNFTTASLDTSSAGVSCSLDQLGNYIGVVSLKGGKLLFLRSIDGGTTFGPYTDPMFDPLLTYNAEACAVAMAAPTKGQTDARAHIVYFYQGVYKYVTNDTDTGVWTTPETVYTSAMKPANTDYFGLSIAVGSDGLPQVAFLDYTDRTLRYIKRTSAEWPVTAESVNGANLGGVTCALKLDANGLPRIAYGALVFDSGSSSYLASGVKYAVFSNATPGGGAPKFTILGRKKITTAAASVTIKGNATNAISVKWKAGSKPYKTANVTGGLWKAKIGPLRAGKKTVVKFQAYSSTGAKSAIQTVTITRKK